MRTPDQHPVPVILKPRPAIVYEVKDLMPPDEMPLLD